MIHFSNTEEFSAEISLENSKSIFLVHLKTNKITEIEPYNIDKKISHILNLNLEEKKNLIPKIKKSFWFSLKFNNNN